MANQSHTDKETSFSITEVQSIADCVVDSGFSKEFSPKEHPMACCCCYGSAVAVIPDEE